MSKTPNRVTIFLNAIGRALIGDINGPVKKKISPLDIHIVNEHLVIDGVQYTADEAMEIAVQILKRIK